MRPSLCMSHAGDVFCKMIYLPNSNLFTQYSVSFLVQDQGRQLGFVKAEVHDFGICFKYPLAFENLFGFLAFLAFLTT